MKKLLFAISIITVLFSQVKEGRIVLNPNLSFSHRTESASGFKATISTLQNRTQIGYFFTKHLMLGASVNFRFSSSKIEAEGLFQDPFPDANDPNSGANNFSSNDNENSTSHFEFGPVIRYYIQESTTLHPFLQLEYTFSSYNLGSPNTSPLNASDKKGSINIFRIGAGASYFVSERGSVDINLYYQNSNEESDMDEIIKTGFHMSIGFALYF